MSTTVTTATSAAAGESTAATAATAARIGVFQEEVSAEKKQNRNTNDDCFFHDLSLTSLLLRQLNESLCGPRSPDRYSAAAHHSLRVLWIAK